MKKADKNNITNKKIFITGGAGFIANKIISSLINKNKIIVYDNFTRDTLSKSKYRNHKNIKIIKGDVLDINLLKKSMKGSQIVIHAAAIAGIDTVIKDPVKTMQVNFIGTSNTLEAAKINKVKNNFIDFSTSEIFGNYAYKSNEDTNAISGVAGEARWTYAVSKLAAEHLVLAYHNKYGLPTTTVRPFNIYGPGQDLNRMDQGMVSIFMNLVMKKDIINSIYMQIGFSKKISETILEDIFEIILKNIIKHQKVKIAKFGTFSLRKKKQRIGRNPKTNENKIISERNVILFKASKEFKSYINKNE